jgi:hypothetical protein
MSYAWQPFYIIASFRTPDSFALRGSQERHLLPMPQTGGRLTTRLQRHRSLMTNAT